MQSDKQQAINTIVNIYLPHHRRSRYLSFQESIEAAIWRKMQQFGITTEELERSGEVPRE